MQRTLKALGLCSFIVFALAGGSEVSAKSKESFARADLAVFDTRPLENLNANQAAGAISNYLLYGYNAITSPFVSNRYFNYRYKILDDAKLTQADYDIDTASSGSDILYAMSTKASELLKQLNVSASVSYKGALFSGKVATDYGLTSELKENQKLIKYMQNQRVGMQYLTANDKRLKELLTQQFKDDMEQYAATDPERIFNTYGTHLVISYYRGGRAELNFKYNSRSSMTDQMIKASASAAYAGFSGDTTVENKQKAKEVMENSEVRFNSTGGDNITGSSPEEISKQFPTWVASLKNTSDICAIADFDKSMLPVWELTDDAKARKRLQAKFDELLLAAQKSLEGYDPVPLYVTDLIVVADRNANAALAKIPSDYVKVMLNPGTNSAEVYDANRGAGGDFIFIAYKLGRDKLQAITDIYADWGKNIGDFTWKGHRYQKIPVDLNSGAGGNFIYLFYAKANPDDTQFVQEIRGVYGMPYTLPSGGWQWTKNQSEMVDMNRGCGSKKPYVYAAYRTGN